MKKKFTGERLETTVVGRIATEHLHRYALSLKYVENKIVLDIACGEGYGSDILSKTAKFVYGVDIDKSTVEFARNKYSNRKIKFSVGSTSDIPLEDNSVDVITSFETIEHHDEHIKMMMELKRVLTPEGILIISSPDKLYYSDNRGYKNKFHVKELYKNEFKGLIGRFFKNSQLLSQNHINGISLILNEENISDIKLFTGSFNMINIKKRNPMFLVSIASDVAFEEQKISVFDGAKINSNSIEKATNDIKKTITFKVGQIILFPFRLIRKAIQ